MTERYYSDPQPNFDPLGEIIGASLETVDDIYTLRDQTMAEATGLVFDETTIVTAELAGEPTETTTVNLQEKYGLRFDPGKVIMNAGRIALMPETFVEQAERTAMKVVIKDETVNELIEEYEERLRAA